MEPQAQAKRSLGPVIGIIVIVLILVAGAFYVWGSKLSPKADDVSSIEQDLSGTDVNVDLSDLDSI